MIVLIGDVHAEFAALARAVKQLPEDALLIQVGDLGAWPPHLYPNFPAWEPLRKADGSIWPLRFIRGNHDYEPELVGLDVPTELRPGLIFMPDGWVEELDGRLVGFLGGGHSIDRAWRVLDKSWWASEVVTHDSVLRLAAALGEETLDLLVTHVPPLEVVSGHYGYKGSPSDALVTSAWERAGRCKLVCGHMHEPATYGKVRVLDILEMLAF